MQGVLINATSPTAGYLEFGPNPLTPIPNASVPGSPLTTVEVSVNGAPPQPVSTAIDSGGQYGALPASLVGNDTVPITVGPFSFGETVPAGTTISVYTSDGATLLYSYTTTASTGPLVTSTDPASFGAFNTGAVPFVQIRCTSRIAPAASGRQSSINPDVTRPATAVDAMTQVVNGMITHAGISLAEDSGSQRKAAPPRCTPRSTRSCSAYAAANQRANHEAGNDAMAGRSVLGSPNEGSYDRIGLGYTRFPEPDRESRPESSPLSTTPGLWLTSARAPVVSRPVAACLRWSTQRR